MCNYKGQSYCNTVVCICLAVRDGHRYSGWHVDGQDNAVLYDDIN